MPLETKIDPESGFRTHVVRGVLDLEEVKSALEEVYARPDFKPEADTLCDLRQADLGHSSRAIIKGVVDYVREHRGAPPGARTAIVAGRDLDYGIARMYEQLLEAGSPSDVMVFRTIDEAEAWLKPVAAEDDQ